MKLDSVVRWVERITSRPSQILQYLAQAVLLVLMFLTVGDVTGRYMVGKVALFQPIPGTFELTEFMLVIVVFTALSYAQVKGDHISIDLLTSRMKPRGQGITGCIVTIFGIVMFCLVTWRAVAYAGHLFNSKDVSGVLKLPVYPFLIIVAIGSFMFCLTLVGTFFKYLQKAVKREP